MIGMIAGHACRQKMLTLKQRLTMRMAVGITPNSAYIVAFGGSRI
jgi:hypothetical protein